jgi:hypothetical protein
LVFAITTLDLFVFVLLDLALEYPRPCRLVEPRSLEDVCRIDPVVVPPTHDMLLEVRAELELVNRYLDKSAISFERGLAEEKAYATIGGAVHAFDLGHVDGGCCP